MSEEEYSTVKLTAVLAGFLGAGSLTTFVVWHTLSEFVAGRPVEGGQYLLALALLGVFAALAWLLGRYVQGAIGDTLDGEER